MFESTLVFLIMQWVSVAHLFKSSGDYVYVTSPTSLLHLALSDGSPHPKRSQTM